MHPPAFWVKHIDCFVLPPVLYTSMSSRTQPAYRQAGRESRNGVFLHCKNSFSLVIPANAGIQKRRRCVKAPPPLNFQPQRKNPRSLLTFCKQVESRMIKKRICLHSLFLRQNSSKFCHSRECGNPENNHIYKFFPPSFSPLLLYTQYDEISSCKKITWTEFS